MGVSVRHNSRLAALVALAAAVMTVAWFARALQTASTTDWLWCVLVVSVALLLLVVVRDGRAPLMVADGQGVRVRRGETWRGLRWQDVERVEVHSPASWLRDGQIVVHPGADADTSGAFVVPLGRTTKVEYDGLSGDLAADLETLASGVVEEIDDVEEVEEVKEVKEETEPEFEPVGPGREPRPAARSEVVRDSVRMLPDPPSVPAQRTAGTPMVVARVDEFGAGPETGPETRAETGHETGGEQPRPAEEALIGPLIAAARNRARLSIDVLSERTRIRPHVLECIEVDDFEACGGDFYARGHLRTLARIFGLDPQQLLALYDDHYAKAEIEARQVFEAELASGIGGGVRAAHTGPRWSLLAACVLALVSVWGVARVFNDTPQELVSPAPIVVDSAGLARADAARAPKLTLATLEVSAVGASPQVVVRDRDGRILWASELGEGQRQQVIGLAPFDVTASNGAAVKVAFLGKPKGTVGDSQAAGSKQFG